jgi:hypothetical protein
MRFTRGKLEITGVRRGPDPAVHGEPVTVFGTDDASVFQGGQIDMEAVPPDVSAPIQLYYTFDKVSAA